jgi:hypothetical protein
MKCQPSFVAPRLPPLVNPLWIGFRVRNQKAISTFESIGAGLTFAHDRTAANGFETTCMTVLHDEDLGRPLSQRLTTIERVSSRTVCTGGGREK